MQANPNVQPTNFTRGANAAIVDIKAEILSVRPLERRARSAAPLLHELHVAARNSADPSA
jgi:hypothetical protein